MKFRTQLSISLLALTFGTTLIGLGCTYWQARRILFEELRSKVLTVAATAAHGVNGNLLAQVNDHPDINSPQFNAVVKELRRIRNSNRRNDIYVNDIYTIRLDPANHKLFVVGVDASEDPAIFAYPGESYTEGVSIGILKHLQEVWAPEHLVHDKWGTFLPGYAPIYDANGNYVGTIGVNLSADYVKTQLAHLMLISIFILIITLIIGFLAATFLVRIVSTSLETINEAVKQIGQGDLKTRIYIRGANEFRNLATTINDMAKGLEDREKLKLNFARYISQDIMDKILLTDNVPSLVGESRKITVLFSDIRNFTHLSEKMPPEQVVSLLNEYLGKMLHIIFINNGTLDKFLGDGMMVEFGAPLDDEEQEMNAVNTALQMQHALKELNKKWENEGRPCLRMGIGIHTGLAVVGNIGSEKRMEYTAIGDTVNVASRLEQMSKQLNVDVLISEMTKKSLGANYNTTSFGQVTITGRESSLEVFSVVHRILLCDTN